MPQPPARLCSRLVCLDEQPTADSAGVFPPEDPPPKNPEARPPAPCSPTRVLNPFRTLPFRRLLLGFRPATGFVLRRWRRFLRASSSLSSRRRCWAPRRRRRRSAWSSSTPSATPPPRSARYSPIRCTPYAGHSLDCTRICYGCLRIRFDLGWVFGVCVWTGAEGV